jgi:hypothetical protein
MKNHIFNNILPVVLFVNTCITILFYLIGNYMGYLKFDVTHILRILTGNYFLDALIELIITGPFTIVIVFLFNICFHRNKFTKYLFKNILIYTSISYIFLVLVYTISQFTIPLLPFLYKYTFNYIRPSVGGAFISFFLSSFAYLNTENIHLKIVLALGISAPILMTGIIPLSIEINGISWLHFVD